MYMDNFKVYRNGEYSTTDNLKIKLKDRVRDIVVVVDDFFVNHK